MAYTADNKGSYPFGFHWNRTNPATGFTADGAATGFIAWFLIADQYMGKNKNPDNDPTVFFTRTNRQLSQSLKCPSSAPGFEQQVHYYQNPIVMPHLPMEIRNTPAGQPRLGPARLGDLYPDNAILWDTALLTDMTSDQALPFFTVTAEGGSTIPASFVDESLLRLPRYPELRFRNDQNLMANTDPADALRYEDPIEILTDDTARAVSNIPSYNADMGGGTLVGRQIGNVRFRHNRDTVAVVAFADGSVRTLGLNKKRLTAAGGYYSDFQRQMLMIRWPSNLRTSGTFGSSN